MVRFRLPGQGLSLSSLSASGGVLGTAFVTQADRPFSKNSVRSRGEIEMRMSRIVGAAVSFSLTLCMSLVQAAAQRPNRGEQQQAPPQQQQQPQGEQAQQQRRVPPPE